MLKASVWFAAATLLIVIAVMPPGVAQPADTSPGPPDIDARLDTLFGSHDSVRRFLMSLKQNSANKRWPDIALMVAYPIKVRIAGHLVRIRNSAEFISHSEDLLTPKVLAAIKRQTYASLFANDRGVMIGDGEVWFSAVCRDAACKDAPIRIIAINP
jgi:hypothetical protein